MRLTVTEIRWSANPFYLKSSSFPVLFPLALATKFLEYPVITSALISGAVDVVPESFVMGNFAGELDDMRLYRRALSIVEVATLYNYSTIGDEIADWWKLRAGFSLTDATIAAATNHNPWAHGLTNLQVYQNPSVLLADNYSSIGDGIADWWKIKAGHLVNDPEVAAAVNQDSRAHGLTNLQVYQHPNVLIADNYSTIGDGIADWWKIKAGVSLISTLVATALNTNLWAHGLTNLQVYQNPTVSIADNYSTKGDGIADWWKVKAGISLTTSGVASALYIKECIIV